jgi:hypothetical protein
MLVGLLLDMAEWYRLNPDIWLRQQLLFCMQVSTVLPQAEQQSRGVVAVLA